jgi:hypothetical protein
LQEVHVREEQDIHDGTRERLAASAAVILDPLLADVWQLVWIDVDDGDDFRNSVPLDALAGMLRLAYLSGYSDAANEEEPGALFERLGVRVEAVRKTRGSARRRR